jgi:hypothetical protein
MVKNLFFLIGLLRNFIKIWSFFMGWLIWFFYVSFENLLIWSILELWRFFVLWLSVFFWLKKLKVSKLRLCWSHGLEIITWWSLFVLENVSYFLSILTMIELNDWCI